MAALERGERRRDACRLLADDHPLGVPVAGNRRADPEAGAWAARREACGAASVSDEDLTDFFQSLSSIADACGEKCWVVASVGTGAIVATSFETIFRVVRPLLGL